MYRSNNVLCSLTIPLFFFSFQRRVPVLDLNADPHSLLSTSGADWPYQQDHEMEEEIKEKVEDHYRNWSKKKSDKLNHTLFLACSGVGTGKSRLLTELPGIVKRKAQDAALKRRLEKSLTFNVSFENGTPYDGGYTFKSADMEVGTRMMFQMVLGEKDWGAFIAHEKNHKSIGQVVEYIAEQLQSERRDLTIFLMVDGLQKLDNKEMSKSTPFYSCISTLAGYVNQTSSAFVVCCCAATVFLPVNQVLLDSPQSRLFLLPRKLDGNKIIGSRHDPTLRVLIDDMGGHGRALESLKEELDRVMKLTTLSVYGFSTLANDVRKKLMDRYPDWVNKSSGYKEALALCLSGADVKKDTKVVGDMTVDDILSLGLFELKDDRLHCAYVWIWALSSLAGDSDLVGFPLDDYTSIHRQTNEAAPLGAQCWQHWEEFNTKFRMLKSSVLKGKTMSVTDFHAGAIFDVSTTAGKPTFCVQQLTVQRASHQYHTKSGSQDKIVCEQGTYQVSNANSIFLNGYGAPAGDAFLGLAGNSSLVREVHQYKLLTVKVTSENISTERTKAAGNKDLFLLFSVKDSDVSSEDLPSPCGFVDGRAFKSYYGPFAGRAFYAANDGKLEINQASRFQLESLVGVGKVRADKILTKRPFENLEDAATKTKIPRRTLSRLFLIDDE